MRSGTEDARKEVEQNGDDTRPRLFLLPDREPRDI